MKLLLDSHILIWAINDDPRLSKEARSLILDENNTIYYSVASIWEISIKHAIHPENVSFSGGELAAFAEEAGFLSLDLKNKHVFALDTLVRNAEAPRHQDPFDRILLAQAKEENMSFLTHDTMLQSYEEKCIVSV